MDSAEWCELLRGGSLEVLGRMPWSSNATYLVSVTGSGLETKGIYKPGRGERPLWDFPGDIFLREVAAYQLSADLDLGIVPETVFREEGPFGEGSLQRFIEADYEEHYFTLIEDPANDAALRLISAFDVLANNADRKGGHLLRDAEGHIWGIDHGLCFHADDKLRTVMWDYAGDEYPPDALAFCERLIQSGPGALVDLLETEEVEALLWRAGEMTETGHFPWPRDSHRTHPWPLV